MCTSKLIGSFWCCGCIVLSLFLVLECERHLEYLKSFGCESGLYGDLYLVNLLLSLKYEGDLYLYLYICKESDRIVNLVYSCHIVIACIVEG